MTDREDPGDRCISSEMNERISSRKSVDDFLKSGNDLLSRCVGLKRLHLSTEQMATLAVFLCVCVSS